jgi:hypothetical protein
MEGWTRGRQKYWHTGSPPLHAWGTEAHSRDRHSRQAETILPAGCWYMTYHSHGRETAPKHRIALQKFSDPLTKHLQELYNFPSRRCYALKRSERDNMVRHFDLGGSGDASALPFSPSTVRKRNSGAIRTTCVIKMSLECADQICIRRIAAFWAQATQGSGFLRTRKPL